MACQFEGFERLLNKNNVPYALRQEFFGFYNLTMGRSAALTMPEVYQKLNKEFRRLTGIEDLYFDEKKHSNKVAKMLYDEWKPKIQSSENAFNTALRLSIAGNIMDYGANSDFDVHQTIDKVMNSKFTIDHSLELEKQISTAENILYLGDNAGEIVFDRLFIETIQHKNLTFAVRGGAVLNDATMDDALEIGLNDYAKLISNGSDAPSTVLTQTSPEFLEYYKNADLIISKGQGNLEGLIEQNDARLFFLLMVKCDVMGELLNVPKGSFVVYNTTF
jgi:hypothetical protein